MVKQGTFPSQVWIDGGRLGVPTLLILNALSKSLNFNANYAIQSNLGNGDCLERNKKCLQIPLKKFKIMNS